MTDEIMKYFKNNLKKKLRRPRCGRFLSLWDEKIWKNDAIDIQLDYIKSNDFLLFLYQTKHDLSCVQNVNAQSLSNAIDKFFYLIYEFERYYIIFISRNLYKNRTKIIDDVIRFYHFNSFPQKILYQYRYLDLFKDLIKKIDEWEYWKRNIIISYTKILITDFSYEYAQKVAADNLRLLINNIQEVFNKGLKN